MHKNICWAVLLALIATLAAAQDEPTADWSDILLFDLIRNDNNKMSGNATMSKADCAPGRVVCVLKSL